MTARHPGLPDAFVRLRASGWIISLCLHGSAIFLAGLFVAKIGLAPPSPLFHWDVTVISPHTPATTAPASPSTPAVASQATRPAQRSAPITSMHPTPSQASRQLATTPAPAATTLRTEHHSADPVLPPPPQEIQQTLERPDAPTLPPPPESASEQQASLHATSTMTESPTESQPQRSTPSSPVAESAPAPEPSSPPNTVEQAPENTSAPAQTVALAPSTSTATIARRPDYGWLAATLLPRIEALKQYPTAARLNRLEGRVIVRIIIQEDGQIVSAAIAKSSGHDVLDQAALDTLRQASPIRLTQPLEKPPVTIQIPISYQLGR